MAQTTKPLPPLATFAHHIAFGFNLATRSDLSWWEWSTSHFCKVLGTGWWQKVILIWWNKPPPSPFTKKKKKGWGEGKGGGLLYWTVWTKRHQMFNNFLHLIVNSHRNLGQRWRALSIIFKVSLKIMTASNISFSFLSQKWINTGGSDQKLGTKCARHPRTFFVHVIITKIQPITAKTSFAYYAEVLSACTEILFFHSHT